MQKEIITYKRVNFNEPSTIIHYGQEVKEKIVELFKTVVDSATEYTELALTTDMINSIESFNDTLLEKEKELEKKQKSLIYRGKLFLKKKGLKNIDTEIKIDSYKQQYNEYIAKLEESKKVIESIKQGSINDAKMRKELYEGLLPYLDLLKEVIGVGKEDKEKFEEEIHNEEDELNKLKSDPTLYDSAKATDYEHSIQFKYQLLQLFQDRLTELEKNLVIYKENEQAIKLQQANEFQILLAAESYLTDVISVLSTQAGLNISNRLQRGRINFINKAIEAGNHALDKDAELLRKNIEAVNNLSTHKGIYVSTIEKISEELTLSLNYYIQGREMRKMQTQIDSETIEKISTTLDHNLGDLSFLNSDLGIDFIDNEPKRKKLTYKRK